MSNSRYQPDQNISVDNITASLTTDALSIRNPIVSHVSNAGSFRSILNNGIYLISKPTNLYDGNAFYVSQDGLAIHGAMSTPVITLKASKKMKIFDVRYNAEQTFGNALAQAAKKTHGSDSLSYQDAIINGAVNALSGFYNLVIHPWDNIIKPLGDMFHESDARRARFLLDAFKISSEIDTAYFDNLIYQSEDRSRRFLSSVANMRDIMLYGSGPKRVQLCTQLLLSYYLPNKFVHGIGALNNVRKFGTFKHPPVFKNTFPNDPVRYEGPFLTTDSIRAMQGSHELIYVITENGKLNIAPRKIISDCSASHKIAKLESVTEIHHHELAKLGNVTGAGEAYVVDGVVKRINNGSGHYLPEDIPGQASLKQTVEHVFKRFGLDEASGKYQPISLLLFSGQHPASCFIPKNKRIRKAAGAVGSTALFSESKSFSADNTLKEKTFRFLGDLLLPAVAHAKEFNHVCERPSYDSALASPTKVRENTLATKPLIQFANTQPPAFDKGLKAGLRNLYENKTEQQTSELKKNMKSHEPIVNAAKKLESDLKNISPNDKEVKIKKLQAYQKFSETVRAATQLASGFAKLNDSPEMEKLSIGVTNALVIGENLMGLMAGTMANPALGFIGIAGALASLGGLLGGNEENEGVGTALQAVYSAIHAMWKEFREAFKTLREDIRALAEKVDKRFDRIEKIIRNKNETDKARFDEIARSLLNTKSVIVDAVRQTHLEDAMKSLTKAKKIRTHEKEKAQDCADELFHCIKERGSATRGMHTGLDEGRGLLLTDPKSFHPVYAVLKNQADIDSHIGLLAAIAKQISPQEFKGVDPAALFNPTFWCLMTDAYLEVRKNFIDDVKDEKHQDIDNIINLGKEFIDCIKLINKRSDFYLKLFKGYEEALLEIQKIIGLAITTENNKISAAMTRVHSPNDHKEDKIEIDVGKPLAVIVNQFIGKIPLEQPIVLTKVTSYNSDGYDIYPCKFTYADIDTQQIRALIPPELILLVRLGLASFEISPLANTQYNDFHLNVYFKMDKETTRILYLKYKVTSLNWDNTAEGSLGYHPYWGGRRYSNSEHPSFRMSWNEIKERSVIPVNTDVFNLPELLIKSRKKIVSFFQESRQAVENDYSEENQGTDPKVKDQTTEDYKIEDHKVERHKDNVKDQTHRQGWTEALEKLDLYLNLLFGFAPLAELHMPELQLLGKLVSSEQIKKAMRTYIHDKTVSTPLPHLNFVPDFKVIVDTLITKMHASGIADDVLFRIQELEALKVSCNLAQKIKLQKKVEEQKQTEAETVDLTKLFPGKVATYLKPYRDAFECWQIWCEINLEDQIDGKLKKFPIFKHTKDNYELIKTLFERIETASLKTDAAMLDLLKQLHDACILLHNQLKALLSKKYEYVLQFPGIFSAKEFLSKPALSPLVGSSMFKGLEAGEAAAADSKSHFIPPNPMAP